MPAYQWSYVVTEIPGLLMVSFLLLSSFLFDFLSLHSRNKEKFKFLNHSLFPFFILISGSFYGVALEYISMLLLRGYDYGRGWLIEVLEVPIIIGISWSVIMYSCGLTTDLYLYGAVGPSLYHHPGHEKFLLSDKSSPVATAPEQDQAEQEEIAKSSALYANGEEEAKSRNCFQKLWTFLKEAKLGLILVGSVMDSVLALNIDLSIDAIAIRDKMWTWKSPYIDMGNLFGVPVSNYFGWYYVVFFFSLYARFFRFIITRWKFNQELWQLEKREREGEEAQVHGSKSLLNRLLFWREFNSHDVQITFLFLGLEFIGAVVLPFLSLIGLFITLIFGGMMIIIFGGGFGVLVGAAGNFIGYVNWAFLGGLILLSILLVLLCIRNFHWSNKLSIWHAIVAFMPVSMHGYFLILMFAKGYYRENIWIVIVSFVMAFSGGFMHAFPFVGYLMQVFISIVRFVFRRADKYESVA